MSFEKIFSPGAADNRHSLFTDRHRLCNMLAAARFIITLAKPPPKNLISRKTFWTGFPGFRTSTGTCLAAFALAFSCLSSIALHAQAAPVPFDGIALDVSLVTASPGRGWAEWLGHTGILVGNPDIGEQRFYEFGGFSFDRATVWAAVSGNMTASAREEPAATAMAKWRTHRSFRAWLCQPLRGQC